MAREFDADEIVALAMAAVEVARLGTHAELVDAAPDMEERDAKAMRHPEHGHSGVAANRIGWLVLLQPLLEEREKVMGLAAGRIVCRTPCAEIRGDQIGIAVGFRRYGIDRGLVHLAGEAARPGKLRQDLHEPRRRERRNAPELQDQAPEVQHARDVLCAGVLRVRVAEHRQNIAIVRGHSMFEPAVDPRRPELCGIGEVETGPQICIGINAHCGG